MEQSGFSSNEAIRFSPETGNGFLSVSAPRVLLALVLLNFGGQSMALGQSDDFNDGDDAGWQHLDLSVVGAPAVRTFPDVGLGGYAFRIQSPAPPVTNAGPARAFSYRTNLYDNFYVAVDVLTWDNTLNQAFGFLVRASNIALSQTTGYILNYDPNQQAGGRGQFQINRVTAEAPEDPESGSTTANISLDPNHRYRFVMIGAASTLTGQIYDFSDLSTPLVTISADDTFYPSGVLGLINFSRVGAAHYTNPNTGKADVTFDNFYASTAAPGSVAFPGTPHPIPDMPQVVNRTPAPRVSFYPYTNGIGF